MSRKPEVIRAIACRGSAVSRKSEVIRAVSLPFFAKTVPFRAGLALWISSPTWRSSRPRCAPLRSRTTTSRRRRVSATARPFVHRRGRAARFAGLRAIFRSAYCRSSNVYLLLLLLLPRTPPSRGTGKSTASPRLAYQDTASASCPHCVAATLRHCLCPAFPLPSWLKTPPLPRVPT